MADGAAKERLGNILEKVGESNDGNGYSINITQLKGDSMGQLAEKGMNIDIGNISKAAASAGMSRSFTGALVVAHEGSHKIDTARPGFNRYSYPATGLERMLTEIRAYGLGSAMSNAMGITNHLNAPGLSLKDRERAIWNAAVNSWETGCAAGGASCAGFVPEARP